MLIRIGGITANGLFQHIGAVVTSGILADEMRERLIQRRAEQHRDRIRARAGLMPGAVRRRVVVPRNRQWIVKANRIIQRHADHPDAIIRVKQKRRQHARR